MISDVTLSALANWLGGLTMVLIVLYHVSSASAVLSKASFLLIAIAMLTLHRIGSVHRSSPSMPSGRIIPRRYKQLEATRPGDKKQSLIAMSQLELQAISKGNVCGASPEGNKCNSRRLPPYISYSSRRRVLG